MMWEYKTITLQAFGWFTPGNVDEPELRQVLADCGQPGWELVSTTSVNAAHETSALLLIFKRPIGA